MRRVRTSLSFVEQLQAFIEEGVAHFGQEVATAKGERVLYVIENILAIFPERKLRHSSIRLFTYPISKTPFVVLYDFDDNELRVHFIVHGRADRASFDTKQAQW
jgi:hypothetical protein